MAGSAGQALPCPQVSVARGLLRATAPKAWAFWVCVPFDPIQYLDENPDFRRRFCAIFPTRRRSNRAKATI